MKKLAILAVVFALGFLSGAALPVTAGEDRGTFEGCPVVGMSVNGEVAQVAVGDTPPVLLGGRTMVPLRMVAEKLGARVSWDNERQMAVVEAKAPDVVVLEEIPTAEIGESITTEGIAAKVVSITYAVETNWPTVVVEVTNNGTVSLRLGPYWDKIVCSLSDPTKEAAFAQMSRGYGRNPPVDFLDVGESCVVTWEFMGFWSGVTITSVNVGFSQYGTDGTATPVEVGTWLAPVAP